MNEDSMRFLEEHIPELADIAVKQAYWQTLAAGHCVLESNNGSLVEVHPDGSRKIIKQLPPSTPVTKGKKFKIP
jgi:hypothetical protein